MNALATLRRNQTRRANARARAAFLQSASQCVGVAVLALVSLPLVAGFAYLLAAGTSL